MPLDVAMALDVHEALAWAVMFGEADGGQWSWESLTWIERDG